MNPTDRDLQNMDSRKLRTMADTLKADARLLWPYNKQEAMTLFRLFKRIVEELHRRRNPDISCHLN